MRNGRYSGKNRTARPLSRKPLPTQTGSLLAGTVVTLRVDRLKEIGAFLTDGKQEVFLHRNEMTRPLQPGEEVEVFLYHDHENRLAATMHMPLVREGEYGWLEVVGMDAKLGLFLHNGTAKDVLLFVDDLPKRREEWPRPGDHVLVTLKRDPYGRILAKPAQADEIMRFSRPAGPDMLNKTVSGTVYKVIAEGAFVFTEDEHILFIHRQEMTEPLHMGQDVTCRVSYVREDGRLNGSMRQRKETQYREDAVKLLRYLAGRDGAMPYTDDTPSDVIQTKFGMSKSAFKRAMGLLLKRELVEQTNGWTYMKRDVLDRWREAAEEILD